MARSEPSFINQVQPDLPPCSRCGAVTMLARIEPAPLPGHDFRTFECTQCKHVDTVEVSRKAEDGLGSLTGEVIATRPIRPVLQK
jgi:hypothetical protein